MLLLWFHWDSNSSAPSWTEKALSYPIWYDWVNIYMCICVRLPEDALHTLYIGGGELAQLVRAWGVWPWGHGYESRSRLWHVFTSNTVKIKSTSSYSKVAHCNQPDVLIQKEQGRNWNPSQYAPLISNTKCPFSTWFIILLNCHLIINIHLDASPNSLLPKGVLVLMHT